MGATRREALLLASAAALSPSTLSAATLLDAGSQEIAPGIFVHRGDHALASASNHGDIANLSFIVGSDSVAVIDSGGSAVVGRSLAEAVKSATRKPIRTVINTHMHPDHVLGNAAFETAGVEFVAHHKMAKSLAARAESYMARAREQLGNAFADTKIVYPTRGIETQTTLDLGGRALVLTPRPTAHTDNDLTIFDTATETLFSGDLVFSEHIPTLDGSIRGWLALIDVLSSEQAKRVTPGHGPASMTWPDALAPLKQYLTAVANDVRASIKAGETISEATKTAAQSERGNWRLFDEFNARNVTAAFAELEWE